MSQQILALAIGAFSLSLGQIILILVSIKWLNKVQLTCRDIKLACKDFSSVYIKAQNEIAGLYKKTTKLVNSSTKKEDHILHATFQLEDIDVHLKILLNEFRVFALASNTTSQSKEP
jgi:hypothetical protein